MLKIIPFAHQLLSSITKKGDILIDATCGNGNDTLFLSKLVGATGHIYAFDVQEQAITTTKNLLMKHQLHHITYIQDSHANVNQYLPNHLLSSITGVIFNLGYLPGSDKNIITKPNSTVKAIENFLPYMKKNGRIVLVIYYGHTGGKVEKEAVLSYVSTLEQKEYSVIQYGFINQRNCPPFVIAIEKK